MKEMEVTGNESMQKHKILLKAIITRIFVALNAYIENIKSTGQW